jgi:biopolymer transport protein ExbB
MNPSRFLSRIRSGALALGLLSAGTVLAQAPAVTNAPPAAAPAAAAPAVKPVPSDAPAPAALAKPADFDLRRTFVDGGPLMYPLAGLSVIGVTFVLYFFAMLNQRRIAPPEFVKDLLMMLTYHRYAEARKACEKNRSPAATIALSGLDYLERSDDPNPDMVQEIIQAEGARQATIMQNLISYLMDIATIAPMVGLLGTTVGMLQSFDTIKQNVSAANPQMLVEGLSVALITTVGGLVVGIPAMAFHSYFRNRTNRLIANLEVVSTEFLSVLTKKA